MLSLRAANGERIDANRRLAHANRHGLTFFAASAGASPSERGGAQEESGRTSAELVLKG
jgi:hypothetical protein